MPSVTILPHRGGIGGFPFSPPARRMRAYAARMARYFSEAEAHADGIDIVHEPELHRFAVIRDDEVLGTAHYRLIGDAVIDFDGTEVDPQLRGTGISGLLAQRALSDDVVSGRSVRTSCWFMEGYLEKHPEVLSR